MRLRPHTFLLSIVIVLIHAVSFVMVLLEVHCGWGGSDCCLVSHLLQLSLNFVENLILRLFILAVAGARAILNAVATLFILLDTIS